MVNFNWIKELPGAITVCDAQGTIIEMNDQAARSFENDGGLKLIGHNVLDCHPDPARSKLIMLLQTQQPNVYTIEKRGVKRLIYQSPWYREGKFAGFVEIDLTIPEQIPHFVRE